MSDIPVNRYPMRPDDIPAHHSGLCGAGDVVYVRGPSGANQPTSRPCTCGAGLLMLLATAIRRSA